VLDILFHRLTTWLAPVLVFTMEDVWLARFPSDDDSVHLQDIPTTPKDWLNDPLATKWDGIRRTRRVVTAALEIQRQNKVIGASLEAAPVVYIEDATLLETLRTVPFDDICLTSEITLTNDPIPDNAFTLPETAGIGVIFEKAFGNKCMRCWKLLSDVGTHAHTDTCARCNDALSKG